MTQPISPFLKRSNHKMDAIIAESSQQQIVLRLNLRFKPPLKTICCNKKEEGLEMAGLKASRKVWSEDAICVRTYRIRLTINPTGLGLSI